MYFSLWNSLLCLDFVAPSTARGSWVGSTSNACYLISNGRLMLLNFYSSLFPSLSHSSWWLSLKIPTKLSPSLFLFLPTLHLSRLLHTLPYWESQGTLLYLKFLYILTCLFPALNPLSWENSPPCSWYHPNLFHIHPLILSHLQSFLFICFLPLHNKHVKNLLDLKIPPKKQTNNSQILSVTLRKLQIYLWLFTIVPGLPLLRDSQQLKFL